MHLLPSLIRLRAAAQGASGEDLALNAAMAHLHNVVHARAPPLGAGDTREWDHMHIYRLHSVRACFGSPSQLHGMAHPCLRSGLPQQCWHGGDDPCKAPAEAAPLLACHVAHGLDVRDAAHVKEPAREGGGPGQGAAGVKSRLRVVRCAGVCGAAAAVHALLGRGGHGRGGVRAHPGPRARPCEAFPPSRWSLLLHLTSASSALIGGVHAVSNAPQLQHHAEEQDL